MTSAIDYARSHGDRFLKELEELTSIPSVSTDPQFAEHVTIAAKRLAEDMRNVGLQSVDLSPTEGHPVVYGEWLGAEDAPTVLLYAHYDVQPAMREDGWNSDPFTPHRRNGKIFARGIGDDKLHCVLILKVVESFLHAEGRCPVNLKVVIEGEEEVGSPSFGPWVRDNRERLEADFCLLCDGAIDAPGKPTVCYALRGMMAMEFAVRGPKADLHSGLHGGYVHNPAQVVAEMVSKLHYDDGTVTVPGFYDDVLPICEDERRRLAVDARTMESFAAAVGAPEPWGESDYTLEERGTARPTLEINGIYGGYAGEGMKSVIPATAGAKITCRLVGNQDPGKIYKLTRAYLEKITPPTVHLDTRSQGFADPVIAPLDSPVVKSLVTAYRHHWQVEPVFRRIGGSIPIAPISQSELNMTSLVIGFNVMDAGFHGPNEFIHIELFHKGVETLIHMLRDLENR